MAQVSFELDTQQMITLLNRVRDRAPVAAARAINKSAKSAKTVLVRAVAADVGLPQRKIRDQLVLVDARPGPRPEAKLRVSKRRLTLIRFVTPSTAARYARGRSPKPPLRARLGALGTRTYPGAFVRRIGGQQQVLKRVTYPGGKRLPIRVLRGPSLAKVFVKHWRKGVVRFREQLPKNLASEMRFAARGR
jgi:hypothetical protein